MLNLAAGMYQVDLHSRSFLPPFFHQEPVEANRACWDTVALHEPFHIRDSVVSTRWRVCLLASDHNSEPQWIISRGGQEECL